MEFITLTVTVSHAIAVLVVVQRSRTRLVVPTIVVELTGLVTVPIKDVEVTFEVTSTVEVTVEALRSTVAIFVTVDALIGVLERIEEQKALAVVHDSNLLLSRLGTAVTVLAVHATSEMLAASRRRNMRCSFSVEEQCLDFVLVRFRGVPYR